MQRVFERTRGWPHFVIKLVEHIMEGACTDEDGAAGDLMDNIDAVIRKLDFQDVIMQRVDRLVPTAQIVLKVRNKHTNSHRCPFFQGRKGRRLFIKDVRMVKKHSKAGWIKRMISDISLDECTLATLFDGRLTAL